MTNNKRNLDECSLEDAQAELAENEQLIAELEERNVKLQAWIASKTGGSCSLAQAGSARKKLKTNAAQQQQQQQDPEKLRQAMNSVMRKVQGQINAKLKWTKSFARIKNTDQTKGARVEVPCNDPAIFKLLFEDSTVKEAKDGKLSCSFKTNDEVHDLPFHGKSYRYNAAELCAPCSASLKDGALTFGFKFCIN